MADRVLVTGGSGFIGSNFIRFLMGKYPDCSVVNLDKLTYAGNQDNLCDIADDPRYRFVQGDIGDCDVLESIMSAGIDFVFNFAAETHVDRSIIDPTSFIRTDILGVFVLLDMSRKHNIKRFIQISTDEVYGSIEEGSFSETDPVNPSSPYSASKAGGELLVSSFVTTYGFPAIITRASNNYGPFQYPEKLIPLFVTNAIEDKNLPVYGDGLNVRDWLYVLDHCEALDYILQHGQIGQIYNIGGGNERSNLVITHRILEILDKPQSLIRYVTDRPGHDRRYSIDCTKLADLGWKPRHDFESGLDETIYWYRDHPQWWQKVKQKKEEFEAYYKSWYQDARGMKS